MLFLRGQPANPTALRVRRWRMFDKRKIPIDHYAENPVKRWFGLSFGETIFIGFIRFDGWKDLPPARVTEREGK